MEYLKIYISIEDPVTRQDVNISGRFDLLCDFLAGLNKSITSHGQNVSRIEYTCNFCGAPMENELTDMLERVIDEVGRIEPDYKLLEVARELLAKAKAALGGE